MLEETYFQRLVAMNRNGNPNRTSHFAIDVVASMDTRQAPTVTLKQLREVFSGDGFHTTISTIRSLRVLFIVLTSTDKHPSTASSRFCNNSSKVSPWVAHPGMAGTSAQ